MLTLILVLGIFLGLAGFAWLLIGGFIESVPWGVGMILIPPIALVFSFFHWPEYKVPTIMWLAGIGLYILVMILK